MAVTPEYVFCSANAKDGRTSLALEELVNAEWDPEGPLSRRRRSTTLAEWEPAATRCQGGRRCSEVCPPSVPGWRSGRRQRGLLERLQRQPTQPRQDQGESSKPRHRRLEGTVHPTGCSGRPRDLRSPGRRRRGGEPSRARARGRGWGVSLSGVPRNFQNTVP